MAKVSKNAFWGKDKVKGLLWVSDQAVQDALVVVYNDQTAHEQAAEATTVDNGVGFTGADAEFGSSLAKQVLLGRTLSQKQMVYARKIIVKYWGQFAQALNDERKEKGLPAEAPKLPAGATPEIKPARPSDPNRFTWQPGDLHKVADGQRYDNYPETLFDDEEPIEQAKKEYELFEEPEQPPRWQERMWAAKYEETKARV